MDSTGGHFSGATTTRTWDEYKLKIINLYKNTIIGTYIGYNVFSQPVVQLKQKGER